MIKKIFIDPGHGGTDNGAAWGDKLNYVEEDDANLSIAFFLKYELLLMNDYQIKLSRETDQYIHLSERCRLANEWKASCFISIHCDAFHNRTVSGMSVHCYKKNMLAYSLMDQMAWAFPTHKMRGVKESPEFHVLKGTKMKAVLIECEFLSNLRTRRFLKEPENQVDMAKAIKKGINKFYGG